MNFEKTVDAKSDARFGRSSGRSTPVLALPQEVHFVFVFIHHPSQQLGRQMAKLLAKAKLSSIIMSPITCDVLSTINQRIEVIELIQFFR